MSNKLAKLPPPGQSTLQIRYPYPTASGPPQTFTILSLHQGGHRAHLAHGGAYNPLIGWALHVAHVDLLAQEARNLLIHWAGLESRIITLDGLPREQMLAEKADASPIMQQIKALQASVYEQVGAIQQAIQAEGLRVAAKEEAAEAPKNGHAASVEIQQN